MYHFVQRISTAASTVSITLLADNDINKILVILNGIRQSVSITSDGNNNFTLNMSVAAGDLVECYTLLPLIQPDRFTFESQRVLLSKALARLKKVEYGVYQRHIPINDFQIFPNVDTIVKEHLTIKPYLIVPLGEETHVNEDEIKGFVANKLALNEDIELSAMTNGRFFIVTPFSRALLNFINLVDGVIDKSKVLRVREVSEPNYEIYSFTVDSRTVYNEFDWVGHSVFKIGDASSSLNIDAPHTPNMITDRSYRIPYPVHVVIEENDRTYAANPAYPGIEYSFSFVPDDDSAPVRTDVVNEVLNGPGVLVHRYNPEISFTFKHGYVSEKIHAPTNPEVTIEGDIYPDFEIPTKRDETPMYYAIRIGTTNYPRHHIWPLAHQLSMIASDTLWERGILREGVIWYVTRDPIFRRVRQAIPMTWSSDEGRF